MYIKERQAEQETVERAHERLMSGQYTNIQHWLPYLHSRGLDEEQISRLKLGAEWSDANWLLIPRFNFDGVEVLGHNRRRMPNSEGVENEDEEKYKYAYCNSFVKQVPAGLQTLSRNSKYLVLTEGDFDVINFEREGFAVLGKLSGKFWQVVLSNSENFDCIALAYDNDRQGKEYTQNAAQILFEHHIPFCVVELPEGTKDINQFYTAHIEQHDTCLQELLDNALDGLEFFAKSFLPPEGLNSLKRGEQNALKNRLKDFIIHAIRSGCDKADITDLCNRLGNDYPANWLAEVLKLAEKDEPEYVIVENLRKKHELLYNSRTGFYKYDSSKGIWILLDDKFIGALVREYLGYSSSAKRIHNVTEHLKAAVSSNDPIDKFNRLALFAFKNGTLHYRTDNAKEGALFRPASSTDFVTRRVSYCYDEKAECPTWLQAIDTIFAGDENRIRCFQEFCGYCLLNHCRYQKALILRDLSRRGSNGKSTLLEVLRAVFGEENCTSLEPVEFENEHAIIQLKDAKVNLSTEAKSETNCGETALKKAITGDTLRGRLLYRDFIDFKSTAKIIFAVNGSLQTKDSSGSMRRRFLVIDCPVHFVDDPHEGNPYEVKADNRMQDKLMKELAGIFNWCAAGARRLVYNGGKFTQTDEQSEIDSVFTQSSDSVNEFVAQFATEIVDVDGNGRTLTRSEVYELYCTYCENEDVDEPVSRKAFHEMFRQVLKAKGITFKERMNSNGFRCYDFS